MNESAKNINESEITTPQTESSFDLTNIINNEKEIINTLNSTIESNKVSESDKENSKIIKSTIEQLQSEFSPLKKEAENDNLSIESNEIENKNSNIIASEDKSTIAPKAPEDKEVKKGDSKSSSGGGGGGLFSGLGKISNFFSKGISKLFFILGIPIALGSGIVQTAKKIEKKDEKKK